MTQTLDVLVDSGTSPLPFILHKCPYGFIQARSAICGVLSAPAHQHTALSAARKNLALIASFVSGAAHLMQMSRSHTSTSSRTSPSGATGSRLCSFKAMRN